MKALKLGVAANGEPHRPHLGIRFRTKDEIMAEQKKAPAEGVYTLGGHRFRIAAGDPLPEGAKFDELKQREDAAAPQTKEAPSAKQPDAKTEQKPE
jgi:hypothetical protein